MRISSFCFSVLFLFTLVAVANLKGKLTLKRKEGENDVVFAYTMSGYGLRKVFTNTVKEQYISET